MDLPPDDDSGPIIPIMQELATPARRTIIGAGQEESLQVNFWCNAFFNLVICLGYNLGFRHQGESLQVILDAKHHSFFNLMKCLGYNLFFKCGANSSLGCRKRKPLAQRRNAAPNNVRKGSRLANSGKHF